MTATDDGWHRPSTAPRLTITRTRAIAVGAALLSGGIVVGTTITLGGTGYESLSRGNPGLLVSVTTAALRVVVEWSGAITVSALAYAAFLQPRAGRSRTTIDNVGDLGIVRVSALVWALAASALVVFDAADANGVTLDRVLAPGGLAYLVDASYLPKAWIVVTLCAFIVLCCSWWVRSWTSLLPLIGLSLLALISPVVVHQVLVGPGHDFGVDASLFGTPAVALLFGLPLVVAFTARREHGRLPKLTLTRLRNVLVVSWVAAFGAELIMLFFKTVMLRFLLTSTGGLVALRLLLLLAFAGLAFLVARRIDRSASPQTPVTLPSGFAIGFTVLAAAFIAVTVVMTRIPPPQYFVSSNAMDILFGFQTIPAPTIDVLISTWRLNLLFAVAGAAGVSVYLLAVVRLRRRGDRWPVGRTVAWILGWAVIVYATSSGFGRYSGPSFSIHMIVHMALNMLGPVLLVMGGAVTLFLRATPSAKRHAVAGPHEWLTDVIGSGLARFIFNPLLVFVTFVGSFYVLYLSPLFGELMRFHWSHQLMNVHFLITGYLFYALIIGVDRPPKPLPPLGKLGFVLAAMPFHAFFGVAVMTSTTVFAENFYSYIDAQWYDDLLADQHIGGGIAWAAGELPLLLVVVALCLQWAKQDQREARRKDRHLDSGVDDEFEVYNQMLDRLAHRGPQQQPSEPVTGTQNGSTR
ncbi:putative copper resistance protein D [Plantibacter sp. VKM Ac-1784]|uniref:Copper resistance protein D n=1 Tax=Plantibacter elymi (nom. nud.) TaxID=199708 RepID=A0ABY1RDW7_9MICO|nr:cytochrome c oxidase assembly protein [Plantibacter sp. VKM Ac-1784]SMQ71199.1 putative copper resistance protein D [Plantibacter sp. VKM Ac-1784]